MHFPDKDQLNFISFYLYKQVHIQHNTLYMEDVGAPSG